MAEIHARLVGYGGEHPKKVGQLVGEGQTVARLGHLVAVEACHDTRHLACLLGKDDGVGQLGEISVAGGAYPAVDRVLHVGKRG